MKPSDFFTKEEQERIGAAIREAEKNTSGEIRVHVERSCKEDALDHAAFLFDQLHMHKTKLRNGVLFYLAIENHTFAILGDAGINAVTPDDFWDNIRDTVLEKFKEEKYADGLAGGIQMAGQALKKYFPYGQHDINELSDDISFGEE